jgi:hypothetical protein
MGNLHTARKLHVTEALSGCAEQSIETRRAKLSRRWDIMPLLTALRALTKHLPLQSKFRGSGYAAVFAIKSADLEDNLGLDPTFRQEVVVNRAPTIPVNAYVST